MLLLALGTARPVPWRDLAVLVPLVHLALQATRNTPLLVIVATPILGRAVASCAAMHWGRLPCLGRHAVVVGALALVLSACGLVAGSREPGAGLEGLPAGVRRGRHVPGGRGRLSSP